jgi:hypothetical protein
LKLILEGIETGQNKIVLGDDKDGNKWRRKDFN